MNQDQVIAAAIEARIGVIDKRLGFVVFNDVSSKHLESFYAIAYRAGMERAAEICDEVAPLWDFHAVGPSVAGHCGSAIRAEAHAKNQPESTHDTGNV